MEKIVKKNYYENWMKKIKLGKHFVFMMEMKIDLYIK